MELSRGVGEGRELAGRQDGLLAEVEHAVEREPVLAVVVLEGGVRAEARGPEDDALRVLEQAEQPVLERELVVVVGCPDDREVAPERVRRVRVGEERDRRQLHVRQILLEVVLELVGGDPEDRAALRLGVELPEGRDHRRPRIRALPADLLDRKAVSALEPDRLPDVGRRDEHEHVAEVVPEQDA